MFLIKSNFVYLNKSSVPDKVKLCILQHTGAVIHSSGVQQGHQKMSPFFKSLCLVQNFKCVKWERLVSLSPDYSLRPAPSLKMEVGLCCKDRRLSGHLLNLYWISQYMYSLQRDFDHTLQPAIWTTDAIGNSDHIYVTRNGR